MDDPTTQDDLTTATTTPEQWGRAAMALPGWRWMPGMLVVGTSNPPYRFTGDGGVVADDGDGPSVEEICPVEWPDPDDPATEGCLLRLLAPASPCPFRRPGDLWVISVGVRPIVPRQGLTPLPFGRACIAAAIALNEWPGGAA